jgi:cephalosporin hydroxylase
MIQGKYKNIRLQQNQYLVKNLKNILNTIKPKRIVEIGTARGGMTLLMSDILNELGLRDSKIKTFDITMREHLKNIEVNNIEFYVGNIFNWSKRELDKPEEITNFLSDNDVNLILCDGGNKISEFNILSKYLKKGDIIMAHDYAPNREVFNSEYKDKIWNWLEIEDKHIKKSVEEYNLFDYEMDLIKPTAWVAKIKK